MQAQGSSTRVVLATEPTFKTPPELSIHPCEVAFSELVDADATVTADTVVFKVGTKSAKAVIATPMSADDIIATGSVTEKNLSPYTHVGLWIYSSVALSAGDLQLLLDDTANCASPIETLSIPAVPVVNTWTFCKMALATPALCTAIISVGIKYHVDKGAMTLYWDDIRAFKQGKVSLMTNEDVSLKRNLIDSKTLRSNRNPLKPVRGNVDISGSKGIEFHAHCQRELYYLLGAVSTVDNTTYKTHTFSIANIPSFIYEKGFTDIGQYLLYKGCKMGSLAVDCPQEGFISGTFQVMGAKEVVSAVPFDDAALDEAFTPFDAFGGSITKDGVALATCTSFKVTIDNAIKGDSYVIDRTNPGERYSIPAGKVKISGTLTVLFEDVTLYNIALAYTEVALALDLQNGTGGGTDGNEKLTFYFDECVLSPKAPAIPGDQGIVQDFDFEAYLENDSDGTAVRVVLLNTSTVVA
jgi:hypothetical protein